MSGLTAEMLFGTELRWIWCNKLADDGKGKGQQKQKGDGGQQKKPKSAQPKQEPKPEPKKEEEEDFELFGDDGPDPEADAVRQQRLKEYEEKKKKKPGPIAKSSVVLEVKPWDDETDLAKLEESVRSIKMDGLLWGASRFIPVAFGIKKLQIGCVVEDEKVSIDGLSDQIQEFEDYVQSVDIAAFNKV